MRNLILSGMALFTAFITGCSVPMAPKEHDSQAKAFVVQKDKGTVYIYRNELLRAVIPIAVSINSVIVGKTVANTYFHFDLTPGIYNIDSLTDDSSRLRLNVVAGKNYFVWQEIKIGSLGSTETDLQEMSESDGRKSVTKLKMIAPMVSDAELSQTAVPPTASKSPAAGKPSIAKRLRDLMMLKEEGVITEEEYNQKKDELTNVAH